MQDVLQHRLRGSGTVRRGRVAGCGHAIRQVGDAGLVRS